MGSGRPARRRTAYSSGRRTWSKHLYKSRAPPTSGVPCAMANSMSMAVEYQASSAPYALDSSKQFGQDPARDPPSEETQSELRPCSVHTWCYEYLASDRLKGQTTSMHPLTTYAPWHAKDARAMSGHSLRAVIYAQGGHMRCAVESENPHSDIHQILLLKGCTQRKD